MNITTMSVLRSFTGRATVKAVDHYFRILINGMKSVYIESFGIGNTFKPPIRLSPGFLQVNLIAVHVHNRLHDIVISRLQQRPIYQTLILCHKFTFLPITILRKFSVLIIKIEYSTIEQYRKPGSARTAQHITEQLVITSYLPGCRK